MCFALLFLIDRWHLTFDKVVFKLDVIFLVSSKKNVKFLEK